MYVAQLTEFGTAPEWTEHDDVEPGPGEALVKVSLAALNPFDLRVAGGNFYVRPGLPYVPCGEGFGTVVRSSRFAAGARVRFGAPVRPGALAGLVAVADDTLAPVPDSVTDEVAAGIGVAGMAAWFALRRARTAEGDRVLILGATGVAGGLAVRLAREMGAGEVVGAGRDHAALAFLASDAVSVTTFDEEWADRRFDVIVDFVGGAPAAAAITAAAPGARLVNVGDAAGPVIAVPTGLLRSRGLEVHGHSNLLIPAAEQLAALSSLFGYAAAGGIDLRHEVWPADRLADAWRHQAGSPHRKILIRLP
ncbi:zinc-binding alcohol dehydrogenase family protein [Streptosporangiaceae bacterium NEAU-GS5]|nr:zinc-binding alcohol dehydrogenase family protein [Streptosporangiaceae bacterium NEAU-GS5]